MFVIGIAGGSGSGKSTFVREILRNLPKDSVAVIPQDAYYRDNSNVPMKERSKMNFDHPDAIEFPLLIKDVKDLRKGKSIEHPTYSFKTSTRLSKTVTVVPKKVIIVEGILILSNEGLRNEMDIKLFIDIDADNRLIRIVKRDIEERGRDVDAVLHRYADTVRPMHDQFVGPSKQFADIIVPHGGVNKRALEIILCYINHHLDFTDQ